MSSSASVLSQRSTPSLRDSRAASRPASSIEDTEADFKSIYTKSDDAEQVRTGTPAHSVKEIPYPTRPDTMVGTSLSRFLGFYNPAYNKAYTSRASQLDTGCDEIKEALAQEAKELNKSANRKKDWMKEYLDEQVRYAAINKVTAVRN